MAVAERRPRDAAAVRDVAEVARDTTDAGTAEPRRVVAVVLAAGAGTRFGGAKQLAEVGGEAMVARVVRSALSARAVDEVVVVVGARADEVAAALPGDGERVVRNAAWEGSIGASIACGLAVAGVIDVAVVLLADQPLVDGALIEQVLKRGGAALASGGWDAVRPVGRGAGAAPGHPVLLGPAAIALARELTGDVGVLGRLDPGRVLELVVDGPAATFDVDVPADLTAARALVGGA